MKNTKICPKCNSTEVYSNAGLTKRGYRNRIQISTWQFIFVEVYICMSCGFLNEYVDPASLKSEKIIAKFKENFRKV